MCDKPSTYICTNNNTSLTKNLLIHHKRYDKHAINNKHMVVPAFIKINSEALSTKYRGRFVSYKNVANSHLAIL